MSQIWLSLALPHPSAWAWLGVMFVAYAGFARCIGVGFLSWAPIRPRPAQLALLAVVPALLEEAFWRVWLLPQPGTPGAAGPVAVSALLFAGSHPLQAWSLRPQARAAFQHPRFLLLALVLGLVNSTHYLCFGSIWPLVVFHWGAVVVWIFLLNGAHWLGLKVSSGRLLL